MAEPVPSPGPDPGDGILGLLRVAGVDVALPLSVLREVVPCPEQLAGLPTATAGLLGALVVRDTVLPVLDLRTVLGLAAGPSGEKVVVVVAHGGRVVGLRADEVRGVGAVAPEHRFAMAAPVHPDGAASLCFSHSFTDPDDGRVVSVLDAAALLSRPGLPTVADTGRTGLHLGSGGARASGRTHTLLRCGAHVLALDVRFVHTTVPGVPPRPSVVDGRLCRGVVEHADREVAVVDPLALLGLGTGSGGPGGPVPGAGLVLDLGVGLVVLAVEELLELHEIADADVLPLPHVAAARPDLLAGMARTPTAGPCLVLDGEALLRDPDLVSLARANTRTASDARAASPGPGTRGVDTAGAADPPSTSGHGGTGEPYLTFHAGEDVTTPLEQIGEIVAVPDGIVASTGSPSVLGVVPHRGQAVPLVRLSAVLGSAGAPLSSASCLLLVDAARSGTGSSLVGFVVESLQGILPLRWAEPAGQPGAGLVQLGDGTRLLTCLDLRLLARRVLDGEPVSPGVPRPRDGAGREVTA